MPVPLSWATHGEHTLTSNVTCGEAVASLLEAYGVDTVFGIPGVHTLELYKGLGDTGIRHVQARHEQGAGFMADGYARVSGRPGVCYLITGPGVTNAATPIGHPAPTRGNMLLGRDNRLMSAASGPELCLQLPKDSGSPRTPLLFS